MSRDSWDSEESKPTRRRRDSGKRREHDPLTRKRPGRPQDEDEDDDFDFEDVDLDADPDDEDEDWDDPSDEDLDGILNDMDDDDFYSEEDDY